MREGAGTSGQQGGKRAECPASRAASSGCVLHLCACAVPWPCRAQVPFLLLSADACPLPRQLQHNACHATDVDISRHPASTARAASGRHFWGGASRQGGGGAPRHRYGLPCRIAFRESSAFQRFIDEDAVSGSMQCRSRASFRQCQAREGGLALEGVGRVLRCNRPVVAHACLKCTNIEKGAAITSTAGSRSLISRARQTALARSPPTHPVT